ncbi:MAG: excinuclease ABC subunit UvrC [Bacteroidota bacterium]|jgi:excinuclease ABC subunit C
MASALVLENVSLLPDDPGIYQFLNKDGQIIYVGKAKSLKKRVSSYFNKEQHDNGKTEILVKHIADVRYMVVETEEDALLLENSLIKKHQPKYNVLLKDDKTFPWIVIRKERFPRIHYTRKLVRDGSAYFGPYTNMKMVYAIIELVNGIFKLRNCNLVLSEENISKKKFRVCLEYHIGNCMGPCEGFQNENDYNEAIRQIREILKGNIQAVISYLENLMNSHASSFEYEKAHEIKERIALLDQYKSKSVVVSPTIHNVDVFTIMDREKSAFVNFLHISNGSIIQTHTAELRRKLNESLEELLSIAIDDIRIRYNSQSKEILTNIEPASKHVGINYVIPKIGDKRHLVSLSVKNLIYYVREQELKHDKLDPSHRTDRLMNQMMRDLRLTEQPKHIECFDNSNFQGAFPVGAMSVFRDGRPSKSEYRHFNIKTVTGPDDFASMEEVITRRYSRLLEEGSPLPQLIVVDGGKGQLAAAIKALDGLGIYGKTAIIGIAKKLEEIYFPGDPVPVYLDKKGETLRIIQQLRDEVHRFGITHHRNRRSKQFTDSELASIKGIGETTAMDLLRAFKSVKKVREAALEDLIVVVGNSKANLVFNHYHPKGD